MLHTRPLLGAVLTAAAIGAAGCGSSSDGGATTAAAAKKAPATTQAAAPAPAQAATPAVKPATGPRPTKAAYLRQADGVCRDARALSRSANAVVAKAFKTGDTSRAAQAIENYTPLFAEHVAKLKALRQPKSDARVLHGLLKVMDGQVLALRGEAAALRQQDGDTLQSITQAQQRDLQFAETLGKQYGFKVCGRAA